MKITDAFLGEHAVFYAQFTFLEQYLRQIEDLASIRAQGKLLEAALASHANLEEELLFRELEPQIGPGGPLAVMRMEHSQIEENLARISDLETSQETGLLVLQTVSVAREHFAKEERILYPLAQRTLGGDRLSELCEGWAARRGVLVYRTE